MTPPTAEFRRATPLREPVVLEAVAARPRLARPRRREPPLLELESTPAAAIPEAGEGALRDEIAVKARGRVEEIAVTVEIAHPHVGDLLVRLEAPDGYRVDLHRRGRDKQDDLRRTYTQDSHPGLRAMLGRQVRGAWGLTVEDRAGSDVGTLERWALAIVREIPSPGAADTPGVRIPDGAPAGVLRAIEVEPGPPIRRMRVSVDIDHPWVRDLAVTLLPPGHPPIPLPLRGEGGRAARPQRWTTDDLLTLGSLRGRDPGGTGRLRVADLTPLDVGTLEGWSIELLD